MKLNVLDIGGDVIKDNETYTLKDNKTLNNLVLSSTDLKPGKSTTGHAHSGQEEVYYFVKGEGKIELISPNAEKIIHDVEPGSIVLIKDGFFHRVHAGKDCCYFVCVFDGKRNH